MPEYPLEPGAVFMLQRGKDEMKHYFVILHGPNEAGEILLVNLDSVEGKRFYDDTCIINKSKKHRFITKKSYINYARSRIILKPDLIRELDEMNNMYTVVENDLLARMRAGLMTSKFTRPKLKKAVYRF